MEREVLPEFAGEVELLHKGVSAMRRWKEWRKKEDGVTIVIVALSMTAILSMTALVLDLGLAFYNRAHLQASCDAAALAAARYMKDSKYIGQYAVLTQNGIDCFYKNYSSVEATENSVENPQTAYKYWDSESGLTYDKVSSFSGDCDTVGTEAFMRSPTAFAKIFGVDFINISVHAEAVCTQIPDPDSIFGKAVVAKKDLYFAGIQNIDSVYCDGDIDFRFNHSVVHDAIVSGGQVRGTGNMNLDGVSVDQNYKQCDIDTEVDKIEEYINNNLKPSTNGITFETESPDHQNWPSGWFGTVNEGTLNEKKAYNTDVTIQAAANINSDLYIDGDLYILNRLTIKEGVTVYVTGNCKVGSGLICDGNLIVLGNLHATGGQFTSHEKTPKDKFTYIYVGGNMASFGQATAQCDNIIICAPNVDYFEITGGGTDFIGTIIGKNLSGGYGPDGYNYLGLGSGNLTVRHSDSTPPMQDMIDSIRLTK